MAEHQWRDGISSYGGRSSGRTSLRGDVEEERHCEEARRSNLPVISKTYIANRSMRLPRRRNVLSVLTVIVPPPRKDVAPFMFLHCWVDWRGGRSLAERPSVKRHSEQSHPAERLCDKARRLVRSFREAISFRPRLCEEARRSNLLFKQLFNLQ